jgi:hypothetical protein
MDDIASTVAATAALASAVAVTAVVASTVAATAALASAVAVTAVEASTDAATAVLASADLSVVDADPVT